MSRNGNGENSHLDQTLSFWNYLINGNFFEVEKFLSSNCQIRQNFHENPVVMGVLLSIDYLKEFSSKIRQPLNKLDYESLQHLTLMMNGKQTRFMITSKNTSTQLNYGLSIHWTPLNLILEIVVIKNVTASLFFIDHSIPSSSSSSFLAPSPSPSTSLTMSSSSNSNSTSHSSSMTSNNVLNPPYLIPRPPIVPATLTVTIMECRNLKSRLIRVIERSVCSYVEVNFCGEKRRTETVKYNNFPSFNIHQNFVFEFNETQQNSSIYFTIMDEHFINDDVLATTEIPIESLPNRLDSSSSMDITLPLILEGNIFDSSASDRNRIEEFPPALIVRISKVDAQEWWRSEEIKAREAAEILRIERLEELEREVQLKYTAEKAKSKRLSETAFSMIRLTESHETLQPSTVLTTQPQISTTNGTSSGGGGGGGGTSGLRESNEVMSKVNWVDSNQVMMCMDCLAAFTLTRRKHHCRNCGEVFCGKCCGKKIRLGGKKRRVCNKCLILISNGQPTGHTTEYGRQSIVSVGIGGDSDSGDESVMSSTRW